MQLLFRAILCFGSYVAFVLLPLFTVLLSEAAARPGPPLFEFGIAIGLIAFTVMAFEFALVGRLRAAIEPFGVDALMQFHRLMGIAAFVFVVVHALSMSSHGFSASYWNPFDDTVAARSGAIAWWALLVLLVSSLWRSRIRLRYEVWQVLHALAAMTIVGASFTHMLAVDHHLGSPALRVVLVTYLVLFFALLFRYRVLRPLSLLRRPWEVACNRDEGGDTRTLCVRPVGHDGLRFEPGQFVWLATGRHPFAIEQHPISIASSAEDTTSLELSIKALGDWSREIVPSVAPGSRVWIDGSYGAFTPDRIPGQGFMLIAGGVGITPMRSILLTMRDREDVRPVTLVYAADSPARMIYAEELKALEGVLNLNCVFVFENPPAQWSGESGIITADLLRRHLPRQFLRYQYFVCGPRAMMDATERALLAIGVPAGRIDTERFQMG